MRYKIRGKSLAASICVGVAVLLTYAVIGRSQGEEDLLALVKEGSKNASASIRSGRGKITVHGWRLDKNGGVHESETASTVIFVGDHYKMSTVETVLENTSGLGADEKRLLTPPGTVLCEEVSYDGNAVTVYYPDKKSANIFSKDQAASYWRPISPESCGFTDLSKADCRTRRETVGGVDYIVVDIAERNLTPDTTNFTVSSRRYIDPAKGFTMTRLLVYGRNDEHKENVLLDEKNVEVRDYGGGLFGPGKCKSESYRPNKTGEIQKAMSRVVTYDPEFQLNVPISDSELKLILPSGTGVYDETTDEHYTVQ